MDNNLITTPDIDPEENPDLSELFRAMAYNHGNEKIRAWAKFCDATRPYLVSYIRRTFDEFDSMIADEVAQETLIKVFTHARQYRGKTNPESKAYIRTIARRTALDIIEKENFPLIKFEHDLSTDTVTPEEIGDRLIGHDWEEFLAGLTQQEKQAAILKYEMGLSQKEISLPEEMNLTEGRISQIIKSIKDKALLYFDIED